MANSKPAGAGQCTVRALVAAVSSASKAFSRSHGDKNSVLCGSIGRSSRLRFRSWSRQVTPSVVYCWVSAASCRAHRNVRAPQPLIVLTSYSLVLPEVAGTAEPKLLSASAAVA
ncbi:hypothetical protein Dvina_16630 [Dactylosporangium vinaceum]|nr:hypothetical protein Dvina_16630 [Dactylosporangium vinaceum]